jgi:hypothetical protein
MGQGMVAYVCNPRTQRRLRHKDLESRAGSARPCLKKKKKSEWTLGAVFLKFFLGRWSMNIIRFADMAKFFDLL